MSKALIKCNGEVRYCFNGTKNFTNIGDEKKLINFFFKMNKKSFLKHSGLAFIVRVVGALAGFLMTFVITRSLSVEESGLFFLGFAICSAVGMLCTLGLPDAFIRFVGGYHAQANWGVIKGVFDKGLKAVLTTSIVVALVIFVSRAYISNILFNKPQFESVLMVMAFAIPFFAVYQLVSFAFQGLHKPVVSIFLQNISNQALVVITLLIASAFMMDLTANLLSIIFSCAAFITVVIALIKWFSNKKLAVVADYSKTSELATSAKPLFLIMLMGMLVQYSGQIISGVYLSANNVAYFSVAQRISMLTSFVLIAVNLVAAPRFAASVKLGNTEELRSTSLLCSRIMIIMATPVVVFMFFFAKFLMGLFGEEYIQSAHLLQILIVGQFINVITGSVGYLLNMSGHEKDMRNVVFFSGPLALGLGLLLTPIYGSTGAAIATAIALASQNLLAVYMVKKRLGFNTLNLIR
jgi:O-antigen/teichoic acid export membrane protein